MCGIVGIQNFNETKKISINSIERMISILHHRGPDEKGIYIDDNIGLGHSRLSIIDLFSGSQPIHNEDETLWIVYNGEVYNYPELRNELKKSGHLFYTNTDTEVIVHLYEEMGADCLNHLNGQFAFAIWDTKKKELFLARDRVGIRPLYYTTHNRAFYFASEIKAIFTIEEIEREIDPIAMDQIFTFWTTLPGRTAFKNIKELKPGHFLKVSNNTIREEKYWDFPFYKREEQLTDSPQVISEKILNFLEDAVRIRLRADVPVGAYLSGGLDSSGITALIAKNFNKNVKTFGIRFEEKRFDEGEHQAEMVSYLNVEHSEFYVNNEKIAKYFPDIVWYCENPLLRTAPVPLYLLSGHVNDNGLKVVVTGEGADEIFGGYNIFREALIRNFWAKQPESRIRPRLIEYLYPHIFTNPRIKKTLYNFFEQGIEDINNPFFSHLIRWNNTKRIKTFFSKDLKISLGAYNCFDELKESLPKDFTKRDCLSKAQYFEQNIFLSNYLLSSQGDRVAMANSLEIRLPYLDYRLIDYMAKVPSVWKILGLNEKHILKKAYKNILPESITKRTKHPYRAPIQQSLSKGNIPEYINDMLSHEMIKRSGLFDQNKVSLLMKKLRSSNSNNEVDGMALAGILSSQILFFKFIKNFTFTHKDSTEMNIFIDKRKK